jgi:hypothetical protein
VERRKKIALVVLVLGVGVFDGKSEWRTPFFVASVLAAILAFLLVKPAFGPADTPTRRLSVLAPEGTMFWANPGDSAVSPDGRMLAAEPSVTRLAV